MNEVEFDYNDYIVLTIKNRDSVYIVSDDNDIDMPTVSKDFANKFCKREIISKWFPRPNEICWFIFNEQKELGVIDNYTEDDWEGLNFRYLNLSDLNYSYAQKVEPFFGNLINEFSKIYEFIENEE